MSSTHKAYLVQGSAVTIDPEPVCACRNGRAPELLEMPLGTLKTHSWIQDSCQTWVPTLPDPCDSDKRLLSPPPPHTLYLRSTGIHGKFLPLPVATFWPWYLHFVGLMHPLELSEPPGCTCYKLEGKILPLHSWRACRSWGSLGNGGVLSSLFPES